MNVIELPRRKRMPSPSQLYAAVYESWKAERDRSGFNYRLYADSLLQLMCDFAELEVGCQVCQKAAAEWSGLNAIRAERERRNG